MSTTFSCAPYARPSFVSPTDGVMLGTPCLGRSSAVSISSPDGEACVETPEGNPLLLGQSVG